MHLVSWNVNGIRAALKTGQFEAFLAAHKPDVLCLQETKVVDQEFPYKPLQKLGFEHISVHGQKGYNGVAILAKSPIEVTQRTLPGDPSDTHARYLEALIGTVRVASIYVPNGNPIGTEKFAYKLRWMERLSAHARELLASEEALVATALERDLRAGIAEMESLAAPVQQADTH